MDKLTVATGAGIALALMYGWMPVCWAIGKVAGWL